MTRTHIKRTNNRPTSRVGILLTLISLATLTTSAQSVLLQGGSPTITVSAGVAGGALVPVVNTTSSIRYKQADVLSKLTVQTSCPGQKFGLSVVATAVGTGTAAPTVTLSDGMLATDFVTSIPTGSKKNFTLSLTYTASASFSQGNSTELGNDIHTVTYTQVAQ